VADSLTFLEDPVTVYCYQGATGWGTTLGGAPVVVLGPLPPAPAITAQPRNVLAHAYDTVSFGVTATGTQPLYYQWTFNGTNIAGATSSALTIANVVDTNLGVYAVVVTNSYGAATSSNAVLSMYPFLAVPFAGLDTNWGSTNTLSVEAWGTGPLSYQWFDNGVPINNVTNPSLTLSSIQFSNAGLYSVVVSSPCGSVTNTPQQVVVNPAGVLLGTYPGVTIMGVAGYNYIVQRTANLADTNSWVTVANVALAQPVQVWVDTNINLSAPGNPQQFYTVLLAP
jgi:hypothetical protein